MSFYLSREDRHRVRLEVLPSVALLSSPMRRYPLGQSKGLGLGKKRITARRGKILPSSLGGGGGSRVAVAGLTNHLRKGRNWAAGMLVFPVSLPVPVWVGVLLSGRK